MNKLNNVFKAGLLYLIIFVTSLLATPVHAKSQPQVDLTGKNVLVLHAFEANMPINIKTDQGLRASLDSGGIPTKNQFFEYLELVPNRGHEYREYLAELMRLRYGQRKIDMIITLYAEAVQFLLNEGRDIFPDVPILTLYMSPGIELPKTNRRMIDQQVSYDMAGTLEIALKLVPGAKRVYVVGGVHNSEKKMQNQARRNFKKWEGRLEFSYLTEMPLEEMLSRVSSAPPGTIIFFISFLTDSAGKDYASRDVVQQVSRVSPAPVFGLYDILLGYGIAGGSIASYERNGTRAGQLTLDILKGTKTPEKIPAVLDVPCVPMFDWRQLRHWKLSERALPKGSIVINKGLTLWDFRYYILGALAFFVAETLLMVILVVQRRRKILAEDSLLQKTEELDRFFNVSLDLLCIANTDGYFLRLNPAWERTLGYTREELMVKKFLDFVHPDDLDRTLEAISTLTSQQKVYSFENRYRCKDGTYRWLQWSSTPAGKLIYAAARDVTQHKRAEEELIQHTKNMEFLSGAATRFVELPTGEDIYWYIGGKLRQLIEDAIYVSVNSFNQETREIQARALLADDQHMEAVSRTLGPDPMGMSFPVSEEAWNDLMSGKLTRVPGGIYELLFGKIPKAACDALEKLAGTGDIFVIGISGQGQLYGSATMIMREGSQVSNRDVVETFVHQAGIALQRKLAEEGLKKSEERFRMLVETMNEGLGVQNENGIWTYVNDQLCWMLGRLPGDIVGRPVTEFLDEANQTVLEEEIQNQRKGKYSPYEVTWKRTDGRKVTTIVSPKPIFNPEGRLEGTFAVITDITERKIAEETLKERLRFERLLSDLSARFVSVTPDQVDWEIEDALRRVADFFRVTNCALVKASPEKNTAVVTHAAHPAAAATLQIGIDVFSLFPWSSKMLREGEVVSLSTLDDLPADATVDKETYRKLGVRSILTIPVFIEGSPRYAFSIASRSEERVWPEELISRLQLVGEIFINALERKQIRLQIEERLRFERLISNLSAGFLNLPSDEVDSEINKGLCSITEFFGADRCTIGLFSEDGTQLVRAFEYHSAEAEPAVESIAKEQMPWYMEQLIRGTPVVMNRLEDLPPEADKERQVCLAKGMKSLLSIPIVSGGKTLGSFALVSTRSERVWPEELVQRFRSICQVFANALQRKQMHGEIQNAAEEWRATFDSVQDLVMVLDGEFKVLRVNAASLSFFNLPLERVVGNSCYTLMHGTSKPVEICPLTKMMKSKRHEEAELYDETRKGWLQVSVDPILNGKGEITRVVHTVKDVTERKRAEAEAFETRRELLRLERLSRLGELTASLAHELNQPLTSILTNARAALRFIQSNRLDIGELKEILQDIANDDKRAGDIIRNLRAILKPDEGERELVLINDVLRETISLFNSEAIIRNLAVEMGFADSLPPVHVNKVQIQQVLVNLMMNAAESMLDTSENRRVVIQTLAADGGTIKVAVRDFGPGVEEKELDKIFEPFFTTKRSGLGMGLSLSRSIIEAHGGHIWVKNNPDQGATFYFDLPEARSKETSDPATKVP